MLRLFAFLEAYWWTLAFCVQTQHITMQMSDLKLLLSRHQAVLSHPDSFALNLFFSLLFFFLCNFYLFILILKNQTNKQKNLPLLKTKSQKMNQNKVMSRKHSLSLSGRIKLPLALNGKVLFQKPRHYEIQRNSNPIRNVATFSQN